MSLQTEDGQGILGKALCYGHPRRTGEAACWKGPVMTVELEPAQTEVLEKKKKRKKTFEQKRETKRSISLWDERDAKSDAYNELLIKVRTRNE